MANGQNYIFLSLGSADIPGSFQFEVKTTINSISSLHIRPATAQSAAIQIARIGPHFITLRQDAGGPWQVHQRYHRPDMPQTLQAGLTVYTDWTICDSVGYPNHNTHVLTNDLLLPGGTRLSGCNPDLVAAFDYVRYARPQVPAALAGADLSNSASVSDDQLLTFLGALPNVPGGGATLPRFASATISNGIFSTVIHLESNRTYRVQSTATLTNAWTDKTNFISRATQQPFLDPATTNRHFYRVVSP